MSWDSFHIVFIRCCGIAALLTNTLMFYLICYKSPQNLGVYKYLMLYFAVFEGQYAILDMIALPDSITLRSALLTVVSSKKNHMPQVLLPVFNVLYWTSYGMSLALIDVHFVFRYLVVSGEVFFNGSQLDTNEVDIMGFYVYPKNIHGKQQINWMNVAEMIEKTVEISMSQMSWDTFHVVFLRCCGIAALLTNTLMFHLICYKSPQNLGVYKYLMLYFAVFEGLYAILDMIILPDSYTLESAFLIVISSEKSHMPEVLLPVFNGGLRAAVTRYFAGPTQYTTQFYKEVFFNGSQVDTNEVDIMGFYVYPKDIYGKQQINWMSVAGMVENTVEIKQLFLALVLQTIIPLILMYIPGGFITIFCIADCSIEIFGRILCITIALYPVLDPLPNMFVINTFRHAIFKYCQKIFCLKGKKNNEQPNGTGTQITSLEMR
ncbi:hypothetical protein GCK72_002768 [Caenorhabditis remanei]|uniref:Seven TM Receptor n=1 Tax=Caenorhabditis remanei TaxID=31234 RepID=A0A6A5HW05_CAERE|nr:hypothetical protein GCK72_002768 [Caenorhabditis remanei]KAF1770944.1 hypothetical protein GCK72_002768 [Caenorhabditis remanei]